MLKDEKQQIVTRLKDYCAQKGSQNKAANSMTGVSSATVSKVLSGDWDTISDEMWRTIAAQIGHERKGWNIAPTQAYKRMTFLLTNAQRESLVLAVTGEFSPAILYTLTPPLQRFCAYLFRACPNSF